MKTPFVAIVHNAMSANAAFEIFCRSVSSDSQLSPKTQIEWIYGEKSVVDIDSFRNGYLELECVIESPEQKPLRQCFKTFASVSELLGAGTCVIIRIPHDPTQWVVQGFFGKM
jgi:hypothetical protein